MITVSVLYPNGDGVRFDMGYYTNSHIPMVKKLLGSALRTLIVEEGLSGGAPGSRAPYLAMAHLRFDSLESFQKAFGPHATTIQNDIPNYSSVAPVIQVSEVKLS